MVLFPSSCPHVRIKGLYLIRTYSSRKVNCLVPLHLLQGAVQGTVPDFQEVEWSCSPAPGLESRVRLRVQYLIKTIISLRVIGLLPLQLLQDEVQGTTPD